MELRERVAVSETTTTVNEGVAVSPDENVSLPPPRAYVSREVVIPGVATSRSESIQIDGNAKYETQHAPASSFDRATSVVARIIGGGVLGAALVAALSIPVAPILAATIGAGVGVILPHFLSQVVIRPSSGTGKPTT